MRDHSSITRAAGIGVGIAALLAVGGGIAQGSGNSFMGQVPPEIQCTDWMNTRPVNLKQLKGQVVLLEMWSTG